MLKIDAGASQNRKKVRKNRFLTIGFFDAFFNAKKNEKKRKKGAMSTSTGWVSGLAVAGGEVRRGKPSQTGDVTIIGSETRQHPVGVRRI